MFVGPYPSKVEKESRKKILICDPKSGQACVEKIVTAFAHRAYRRPVTKPEVASLMKFVALAKARRPDHRAGHSTRDRGHAGLAQFPVPHRARSGPHRCHQSASHLRRRTGVASQLLPLEFDARRRTSRSGGIRQAHAPGVLDAQVKRMLADPRAAPSPTISPASGSKSAISMSSSPTPRNFPSGDPNCATR